MLASIFFRRLRLWRIIVGAIARNLSALLESQDEHGSSDELIDRSSVKTVSSSKNTGKTQIGVEERHRAFPEQQQQQQQQQSQSRNLGGVDCESKQLDLRTTRIVDVSSSLPRHSIAGPLRLGRSVPSAASPRKASVQSQLESFRFLQRSRLLSLSISDRDKDALPKPVQVAASLRTAVSPQNLGPSSVRR